MFAFVRFLEDNVCYALPVSSVPGFRPRSRGDFDSQRVYEVYRGPEGRRGEAGLQRAQILALADDKADLENRVMQKKIKIPKLSASDPLDDSGDPHDYDGDEMELRHSKRLDGKKFTDTTHKSLEAVVARLEKQNGMSWSHNSSPEEGFMDSSETINSFDCVDGAAVPRALYEELLRSYQQQQKEMRHIQQELERTRRQLVQQAKKLKEYGTLVSEVKELRDLNRRLQEVLLLRLGSELVKTEAFHADVCSSFSEAKKGPAIELERVKSETREPEPELPELPKTFSEEANTSSYYPVPVPVPVMDKYILENGENACPDLAALPPSSRHLPQVHLGSGIWVDEERWHQLQVTQGDSKFTKNLAVMIWGTDVLKNRSVTGVATKKRKDAVPKPPLSPHKLSLVRECLYDRIAQETADETEIAQRLSKVNKYICEKIMDINKSRKNEERREAKFNVQ